MRIFRTPLLTLVLVFATLGCIVSAQSPADAGDDRPIETGCIEWLRDMSRAQTIARQTGRPLAILFQEIPGCQTCQDFGMQVLSHPLLVEAWEDCFVPVLVYNNRSGADGEMLDRFDEPSWNNPVVRYLDGNGQDLIARADGIWDAARTAGRMIEALRAAQRPIPPYLQFLALRDASVRSTTFAMHCFWEGEARLGGLPGVTATRAGWIGTHEVVQVTFDRREIRFEELLQKAKELQCSSRVYAHDRGQWEIARKDPDLTVELLSEAESMRDAEPADQRYFLRQTPLVWLPLTDYQATKVNAAVAAREDVQVWLSPRQRALRQRIQRVLEHDLKAFAGLEPLPAPDQLADYAQTLAERIAKMSKRF